MALRGGLFPPTLKMSVLQTSTPEQCHQLPSVSVKGLYFCGVAHVNYFTRPLLEDETNCSQKRWPAQM